MKLALVLGLITLVFAVPAGSQVPDDKLVVPGERVGKWTLGMTIDDLLRVNGQRRAVGDIFRSTGTVVFHRGQDMQPDIWIHRWDHLGLRAWTVGRDSQNVVVLVALFDEFKTAKGISAGATQAAVEAAYGTPSSVTRLEPGASTYIYDEIGLAMSFTPTNEAVNVRVFRPGIAKQIWKL